MLRVGLTGGYASGKSFVAAVLERLGCSVIYADKLGHEVLQPEGEAYRPVVEEFGPGILREDGAIDRKALGTIVFAAPDLLAKLSEYVHPAVFRLEEKMLHEIGAADPRAIVVIEAAILIETGRYRVFDRLVLTTCSEEIQIERGMRRDGLTREQAISRLAKQMSLAEKKKFADYWIDTSGSKDDTTRQVQEVMRDLQTRNQSDRP